jgi:TolB protein
MQLIQKNRWLIITAPCLALLLSGCPLEGRVLYQRETPGTGYDIYMLAGDGASETAVAATSGSDELPTINPASDRIAYASNEPGNYDIFSMPLAGGAATNLTQDPGQDLSPDWSSTDKIAFASDRDGDFDIYIIDGGGPNLRRLMPNNDCVDSEPAWSPDAAFIAFSSDCGHRGSFEIERIGTSPQNQLAAQRLAFSATRNLTHPRWSPDGSKIVYTSCSQSNVSDCDLMIMNADGTGGHNLTLTPNIGEVDPTFSGDGKQVIFAQLAAGGTGMVIARMPVDGGAVTVMSPGTTHGRAPRWVR